VNGFTIVSAFAARLVGSNCPTAPWCSSQKTRTASAGGVADGGMAGAEADAGGSASFADADCDAPAVEGGAALADGATRLPSPRAHPKDSEAAARTIERVRIIG
jgi:hypothetical protein